MCVCLTTAVVLIVLLSGGVRFGKQRRTVHNVYMYILFVRICGPQRDLVRSMLCILVEYVPCQPMVLYKVGGSYTRNKSLPM